LDSYDYSYAIGESVNLGCAAIDDVDGPVLCTYSGIIDTNTPGDYNITYTAKDSSNNVATLVVAYTIYEPTDYLSWDLSTYYDAAEGKSGTQLEEALRAIVSVYTYQSYDAARYILDETDADPDVPGNILILYSMDSVSGVWDNGVTWNREHIWPQSYLGDDTIMTADLHNLKPSGPSENSSRGNKYFDDITTTNSYEPGDGQKGDIARILFYMLVRYEILELVDDGSLINTSSYNMGLLETLLSWHELDPVDDFERNRNVVIYSYQNNRNPFIDYPHLVELMFEDHPYYN
jgi:endonuclease I